MKICIAGKNEIAVHGLEICITILGRENVLICPNVGDDGVSRWQPSLVRFAKEWGVKIVELNDLYEIDDLIFFSLEFDKIICPNKFKKAKLFNIHFSKLPAYKGMFTSAWPILNGEKYSGVTLHQIDEGIDTGDIIDQIDIKISEENTARDLYFMYMNSAKVLLDRCLCKLIDGNYALTPQSAYGSSYYSKLSINYSDINLQLRNTAEFIYRQVKAFNFREFQIPHIDGFQLGKGKIQANRSKGKVGRIIFDGPDAIAVSAIDFDIRFERNRSWDFFVFVIESNISAITNYVSDRSTINFMNANGWTPLIIAAYEGKYSVCRALLEAGADLKISNQNGTTALMYAKDYAVRTGDFSVCKLLLESGCNLFQRDRFGFTVIDYSKIKKEMSAIRFFGSAKND